MIHISCCLCGDGSDCLFDVMQTKVVLLPSRAKTNLTFYKFLLSDSSSTQTIESSEMILPQNCFGLS